MLHSDLFPELGCDGELIEFWSVVFLWLPAHTPISVCYRVGPSSSSFPIVVPFSEQTDSVSPVEQHYLEG